MIDRSFGAGVSPAAGLAAAGAPPLSERGRESRGTSVDNGDAAAPSAAAVAKLEQEQRQLQQRKLALQPLQHAATGRLQSVARDSMSPPSRLRAATAATPSAGSNSSGNPSGSTSGSPGPLRSSMRVGGSHNPPRNVDLRPPRPLHDLCAAHAPRCKAVTRRYCSDSRPLT
jgi:hypothetical protein